MALTLKGSPQQIKVVGSPETVAKDAMASAALKASLTKEEEEKLKGAKGGKKA